MQMKMNCREVIINARIIKLCHFKETQAHISMMIFKLMNTKIQRKLAQISDLKWKSMK